MQIRRSSLMLFVALAAWVFALGAAWSQDDQGDDGAAPQAVVDGNADDEGADDSSTGSLPSGSSEGGDDTFEKITFPLITLGVGIAIVLGLIIALKVNAFIALITAAIVVSLMAPGDWAGKAGRVASAFGSSAAGIAIVIAMAAVIGKCMLDSGAADRIVRAFLSLLGERRAPVALMGSGFVLAVPVFFDTVFYLLVPLARSMHNRTGKNYLMYILAIGAGGAITHTMVPPTPGPLIMAENLNFEVGEMILIGTLVALPAAICGLVFGGIADRLMKVPMRKVGSEPEPEPLDDSKLPSLFMSLLPVLLPVVLISTDTVITKVADDEHRALLAEADIGDWPRFLATVQDELKAEGPNPGKRLVEAVTVSGNAHADERQTVRQLLESTADPTEDQKKTIIDGLNAYVLPFKDFHREPKAAEESFLGFLPNPTARGLLKKDTLRMKKVDVERRNRALLESVYSDVVREHDWNSPLRQAANWTSLFGDKNLVLLLAAVIAMWTLVQQRGLSRTELAGAVETSLMSGGVIILITAGGGAFGAMLQQARIGQAIESLAGGTGGAESSQITLLMLAFLFGSLLKIAQGSGTVSMIVGTSMIAAVVGPLTLEFHAVYLACAVGSGSLVCSWMNDSGFWIFAKMGGLTEVEALKSWTVMLAIMGLVSLAMTVALSFILPFPL